SPRRPTGEDGTPEQQDCDSRPDKDCKPEKQDDCGDGRQSKYDDDRQGRDESSKYGKDEDSKHVKYDDNSKYGNDNSKNAGCDDNSKYSNDDSKHGKYDDNSKYAKNDDCQPQKDHCDTKPSDDCGKGDTCHSPGEALANLDFSHGSLGSAPDHSDTHAALTSMSSDHALDYAIGQMGPADHFDMGHIDMPADTSHDMAHHA